MSFLKNTANQRIVFPPLIDKITGTRITAVLDVDVRIRKDNGAFADGAGTLSLIESNKFSYAFTQAETDCDQLDIILDEAGATTAHTLTIFPAPAKTDNVSLNTANANLLAEKCARGVWEGIELNAESAGEILGMLRAVLTGVSTGNTGDLSATQSETFNSAIGTPALQITTANNNRTVVTIVAPPVVTYVDPN